MSIRNGIRASLAVTVIMLAGFSTGVGVVSAHQHQGKATAALKLKNAGYLTVGTDATYPPMESYDTSSHAFLGADIDLGNALAKAMGLKGAKFVNNTFSTIILSLGRGNFDVIMSSMNDTPDRAKQIFFVDYMRASEGIVVRSGSGIHANSYSALCGKTVTVQDGTTEASGMEAANKTCKSKISIKKFPGDTAAYQAFAAHKSDAYTTDLPVAALYVKQSHGQLVLAGKPFGAGQDYGIGVPKNNSGLRNALKSALGKVRASGQYKSILTKWGVGGATI
jgi:polar amino acid transport system substrate-binding protein